jgi:hypothetical protein
LRKAIVGCCDVCQEDVFEGQNSVRNENGNIIHEDCLDDMSPKDVLEFCGLEIKEAQA